MLPYHLFGRSIIYSVTISSIRSLYHLFCYYIIYLVALSSILLLYHLFGRSIIYSVALSSILLLYHLFGRSTYNLFCYHIIYLVTLSPIGPARKTSGHAKVIRVMAHQCSVHNRSHYSEASLSDSVENCNMVKILPGVFGGSVVISRDGDNAGDEN